MKKETKNNTQPLITGKIEPREITTEVQESYLDYAMSVIISRALPDVRDGLKPVHRRILYAMWNMGLKASAKYRKSATVVGECFVKDTLVTTERGLVPIQKIKSGERVYTRNGLKRVTELYEMPPKDLIKITLDNGIEQIITTSQKFKILKSSLALEWKKADELTLDDVLVARSVYQDKKHLIWLGTYKDRSIYLTKEIAYVLGLFTSDGWITDDYGKRKHLRFGFVSEKREVMEMVRDILSKEFGYFSNIQKKTYKLNTKKGIIEKEIFLLRINCLEINNFLRTHLEIKNIKADEKQIPEKILQSPKEVVYAFLSGLIEGDGHISASRNLIQYSTISKKLSQQFGILLQYLGIRNVIYSTLPQKIHSSEVNGREVKSQHTIYSIEIRGEYAVDLAKQIQLANREKHARIVRLCEKIMTSHDHIGVYKQDIIPFAGDVLFRELSEAHIGSGWYEDAQGQKFRMGIKYPSGSKIRYAEKLREKPLRITQILDWGICTKLEKIGSPFFEFIKEVVDNNLYFVKIKSIEKVRPEQTYDIQVEEQHEFLANGIVSHNCLGKYHPHGDMAVYDSMVRMAQDFSLRYPLVDGQGNFGSLDGDNAAAHRYTEARLTKTAEELLYDIDKETIDFIPNYDGTHKEPKVLPSKLPNLLLNGTMGIAVGMATNIPPHNLGELCDGLTYLIDNPECSVADLFELIKGPDFPTGGIIFDKKEVLQTYATGRGGIVMQAKADIEEEKSGQFRIVIREIPYQVNKAALLEKIAELVNDKKLEGIRDIRDESSKGEVRVVIELKRDAYPKKVLNRLFATTQLQETFHVNMLALVDGLQPRVLNLKSVLEYYLKHRQEVIRRRTSFELLKAKERAHILEGLHIAILDIDRIISTIKKSEDRDEARTNLMAKFKLTEAQAVAILEMRLQQLANLERLKVEQELKEKKALIKELESILASEKRILGIIKKEIQELKENFADVRRTQIVAHGVKEFSMEDLIPNEATILMVTRDGYIKRLPPETFRTQARGGKGVIGLTTKEEDVVEHLLSTTTHTGLLFFTTSGRVFELKAYDVPETSRTAKGQALVNFLQLAPNEKVSSILSLEDMEDYNFLVMMTRGGLIKKSALTDFSNVRRSGLIAIKLKNEDSLNWVKPSTGEDEVTVVTALGQAIRFRERDVRSMGRAAAGVRGIRLKKNDKVVGMDIISPDLVKKNMLELFVIAENGLGKRTNLKQYKVQHRSGSGIKTSKVTTKTGKLICAYVSNTADERDLIIISKKGQVIRLPFGSVSSLGRATQGVRLMRFKEEGDSVASVTFV